MTAKTNDSDMPKMSSEIPRLSSELAAQAAIRAQQILRKQSSQEEHPPPMGMGGGGGVKPPLHLPPKPAGSQPPPLPPQHNKPVPAIPARSSDRSTPPEIPPKRHSLKSLPDGFNLPPPGRQPPPLPRKPASAQSSAQNSAQNSPLSMAKFKDKPPVPPEKPEPKRSSNPFDIPLDKNVPSPAPTRASDVKKSSTASSSASSSSRISPTEDFGSEDALRGIESGLRNMERAMQEQMNLRSFEAQNNFDMQFKAALSSGNRHVSAVNIRAAAYERNLSLDENSVQNAAAAARQSIEEIKQLRAQALQNSSTNNLSQLEQSQQQAMRSTIEHHMRSLDRNLPLELQYSRHRSHVPTTNSNDFNKPPVPGPVPVPGQAVPPTAPGAATSGGTGTAGGPMPLSSEFREHIRQQLLGNIPGNVVHNTGQGPGSAAAAALLQHQAQSRAAAAAVAAAQGSAVAALTREEMRLRRRSSHDETQLAQSPQMPVTRLREHWDETSQCVLQRAAQLKSMLSDSQRYEAKRLELEKWLQRMEARAERMGTVATTADILEAQQKEQKSFHAELHQNKPQFEIFNTLTQKLIAVYPADDTTRIKKMTEVINQRYANLNNGVINRGKQLHAAVHSLQSFDRAMDQFLAFLSESESLCESAEAEIERNPLMFKVG
ncbi:dystrophin-like, partial [Musca vetustissima]|uniref:dystrophin-like n=1 Tax=Musca vetustissima TaxID=27455 RepID=UPI002AB60AF0